MIRLLLVPLLALISLASLAGCATYHEPYPSYGYVYRDYDDCYGPVVFLDDSHHHDHCDAFGNHQHDGRNSFGVLHGDTARASSSHSYGGGGSGGGGHGGGGGGHR